MWHVWGTGEVPAAFLGGETLKREDHLEYPNVDGKQN